MKKAVFLGLMLAFLAGSGLAKANYWHEDFESGLGVWNESWGGANGDGWIINGGINDTLYLSPTNSLRMFYGETALHNLTVPLVDFWINYSVNFINDDSGNDFTDILCCNEGSCDSYSRGVGVYLDSGNYTFYDISGLGTPGILTTNASYSNETWENISINFQGASNNYTSVYFYINDEYSGKIDSAETGFFDQCDSPANSTMFIAILGPMADGNNNYDEVYAYDEVPEPCVQNWTCTEWGECIRGYQTRICTDENECGNKTGEPAEIQLCLTPVPNATMNITQACCPISTLRCFDNSTLVEIWNTSAGVAYAFEDCPFGCDNATSSCAPKAFEQNLYLLGIFIFIVVAGLIAIKWAKR